MLQPLRELYGYHLAAEDGRLGTIDDVLFDDQQWKVRYLVVDTGKWLTDRRVVLSPEMFGTPDHDEHLVPMRLTCEKIENAPSIDQHMPISRQHQQDLAEYYGWVPYWAPANYPLTSVASISGPGAAATVAAQREARDEMTPPPKGESERQYEAEKTAEQKLHDPDLNLRSAREVTGYHIHATDGRIGHVEDIIADVDQWHVRQLLVDTRNWLPGGRKVIIEPEQVDRVSWDERDVYVKATRDQVESGREFVPQQAES